MVVLEEITVKTKVQWVKCETCSKKLRPAIDSKLMQGQVGHYVPGGKPNCLGKLIPIGPVEEI